jgi:hypothetical protein
MRSFAMKEDPTACHQPDLEEMKISKAPMAERVR